MNCRKFITVILSTILLLPALPAQEFSDTLRRVVVTDSGQGRMLETLGGVSGTVNVDKIKAVPSFLGNADPIRFVHLLPIVQVNTESDGGIYMQGSEYSHTLLSIQGVPVYGASHLLGFFSVFNPSHYRSMDYSTTAGQTTRLGGSIDMVLRDKIISRPEGEFSAGLLSAQGTLGVPTGRNSTLYLSGRKSYINLLYSSFLKFDDDPLAYSFFDANLTWVWKPTARDRIWIDAFGGKDHGYIYYSKTTSDAWADWYNALAGLHWNHYYDNSVLKQSLYGTLNGLDAQLVIATESGRMPSHIHTYGYRATYEQGGFEAGADVAYHRVQPQNPVAEGHFNTTIDASEQLQEGVEAKLHASYSRFVGAYTELKAGLGGTWYLSPEKENYWGLTPQAEVNFFIPNGGKLGLRYGLSRQVLYQTGLTNAGVPCEFWLLAGKLCGPQWANNFSLAYNLDFGRRPEEWSFSAEAYYKLLHNQLEYFGTIMSIMDTNYSVYKSLVPGEGRAYGVNLMLQKNDGPLTGWISYAFGRSLRTFENPLHSNTYPSNHERPHEFKAVATYDFGKLDVGGTFFAASGNPYTSPNSLYIIGDHLICNYGEHNASRLPAYVRLDLSVNWYFHKGERNSNGLNFSMYNALGRRNAAGYGVHADEEGKYTFRPTSLSVRFLPSLAYFHKF